MQVPVAFDRLLTVDYSVLCLCIHFYTRTHTDSYINHHTKHASKLSLSKWWHFDPIRPRCLKVGLPSLLLMGNKKVQEPIMSAAWIFLYSDNLWIISKIALKSAIAPIVLKCWVHVWNTCLYHVNLAKFGNPAEEPTIAACSYILFSSSPWNGSIAQTFLGTMFSNLAQWYNSSLNTTWQLMVHVCP